MKTKPGFNLRQMCGENIIVAEGEQNIDFSNIISMNESAAYLWGQLQPLESFSVEDMAKLLMEEYEVDEQTALHDCSILAATWAQSQIIEGDDIPQIDLPKQETQEDAAATTATQNTASTSSADNTADQPTQKDKSCKNTLKNFAYCRFLSNFVKRKRT